MNHCTEAAIRCIVASDEDLKPESIEFAISCLKGETNLNEVFSRHEVMALLNIHRRTLDYYLDRGYLERVYGGGQRAIGISRSSYIQFIEKRIHRNGETNNEKKIRYKNYAAQAIRKSTCNAQAIRKSTCSARISNQKTRNS